MTSRPTAALLAAALVAMATACSAPPAQATEPGLTWQPCADAAVECATLPVPVAHDRPDGPHVDLALARLPAQDPTTRRGTLVFHGGGPAPSLPNLLDPRRRASLTELTQWFDVVTFDSRGYGQSAPRCDPALAPPIAILDSPTVHADHQQRVRAYAETCRPGHPALVEHASAEDAAHDIEAIRIALGEDTISFFGNSYGTVFGQEYAEHYGDHLDRLYLDSVVDHTASYREANLHRAVITEAGLHRFAENCAADPACPLHGSDPLAVWDQVIARAEVQPLPAGPGRTLSAAEIRSISPVLAELDRNRYAAALLPARDGDGSAIAALLPPPFPPVDGGQLTECLDFPGPADYAEQLAAQEQARPHAPRVGSFPGLDEWKCTGWPIRATNEPAPLAAPDAPPALLVNATLDPATHITGAQRVADQLPGSALLPVDGYSHSIYLGQPDNRCVRDAVHRYLLDGVLPEPGARCTSTRQLGFRP